MNREDIARIYDVPQSLLPPSPCFLVDCYEVAHVVLYASSDHFLQQPTRPRQAIAFCLKHGGQIYDVIRARKKDGAKQRVTAQHWTTAPAWLIPDLRNDRLPRTSPDPAGWIQASPQATNKPRKVNHAGR